MVRLGRLRFVVYLALAVGVVLGGARLVLSSGLAASRAADRLAALIGVPVRVATADIALGGRSSLGGVQIFEGDGARPETPWLVAEGVHADFSAVDMFGDDSMPTEVTLTGAALTLCFDKDGNFLTRLPKPGGPSRALPKLRLENARLTIQQDGRAKPLTVTGVRAEFTHADGNFRFEGVCRDADWGTWTVRGSYDIAKDVFRLALRTDRVEVTAEKLALLPFVSKEVWREVRITGGGTPAEIDLAIPGDADATFKIALKPENVSLHVDCIDLSADRTSGEVIIEDGFVQLRKVKGHTASGTIETEADLDFRPYDPRLLFKPIRVTQVELEELPAAWGLRDLHIKGKLTGAARLDVTILDNGVRTEGGGEGLVRDTILGQNPIGDIQLKMTAHGAKIRILPVLPALPKLPFG